MKTAPCKNCENKGCGSYHDQCDMYEEYRKQVDEIHERRRKRTFENEVFGDQFERHKQTTMIEGSPLRRKARRE